MYFTPETLLDHTFEDLRKLKAPNNRAQIKHLVKVKKTPKLFLRECKARLRTPSEDEKTPKLYPRECRLRFKRPSDEGTITFILHNIFVATSSASYHHYIIYIIYYMMGRCDVA
jgi:hypothetical protein